MLDAITDHHIDIRQPSIAQSLRSSPNHHGDLSRRSIGAGGRQFQVDA